MQIQPTKQQKEAIDKIRKHDFREPFFLGGAAGCGKAQSIHTLIPTPYGFKKLGDLPTALRYFLDGKRVTFMVDYSICFLGEVECELIFDKGYLKLEGSHSIDKDMCFSNYWKVYL